MTLFDRDLIEKYGKPGPRYTSYPTAPHLHEEFREPELKAALLQSNQESRPLSLYVHLPFCRSLCLFCACHSIITNRRDRIAEYLDHFEREIALVAGQVDSSRKVAQLHWGGGSPSHLEPGEITRLSATIKDAFQWSADIEASVEIDPRGVTRDHIEAFAQAGFNRVSLGVQDVHLKVQQAVNRVQPIEQTAQVIEWCRELGIDHVNIDLMYGLPHQSVETYEQTLDAVLALDPNRFSVFNFAFVPWLKPHQKALEQYERPNAAERLTILERIVDRLTDAGFCFIGMDHFARPDDELAVAQRNGTLWRNFQGYTTRSGCDLLGFGVTALGLFDDAYYQNQRDLPDYYERIDSDHLPIWRGIQLTEEDQLRRHIIMSLMCHFEVSVLDVENRFDTAFWNHFSEERALLERLAGDGLVELGDESIQVREPGRFLIRNIAMVFDAYLTPDQRMFSQTI